MLAQNRAHRWFDLTMSAQRLNAGPLSPAYSKISERFDRPIIRTFQRHPGNQVPEVQMTVKVNKIFYITVFINDTTVWNFFRLQKIFNNQRMKQKNK